MRTVLFLFAFSLSALAADPVISTPEEIVESERARAIAALEASKKSMLDATTKEDEKKDIIRIYDATIAAVKTFKTDNFLDLKDMVELERSKLFFSIMGAARDRLAKAIPARKGPAPKPGEKREAALPNGDCSNDFMVDAGFHWVLLLNSVMEYRRFELARDKRQALDAMLDSYSQVVVSCDGLTDRYGDEARCTQDLYPADTTDLRNVSRLCRDIRGAVEALQKLKKAK